jgi:hypothetical protein
MTAPVSDSRRSRKGRRVVLVGLLLILMACVDSGRVATDPALAAPSDGRAQICPLADLTPGTDAQRPSWQLSAAVMDGAVAEWLAAPTPAGPFWQVAQAPTPAKCDVPSACRTIAALQRLVGTNQAANHLLNDGSYAKFAAEFDRLSGRVSNKELPCRFNVSPQHVDATPLLGQIHRARVGLKTLNTKSSFPPERCTYKTLSQPGHPVRPQPGEKELCDDIAAIQSIVDRLGQLSAVLKCPGATQATAAGPVQVCPDTTELEKIKGGADRAVTVTQVLARVAENKAEKDEALRSALQDTLTGFQRLSDALGGIIKAGKACNEIQTIVLAMRDFRDAVNEINGAGCDSRKLAKGFDKLFKSAGVLGQKTLAKELTPLRPVFEIMAKNQNFFVKASGAMDPEQRWSRQFAGADGYLPNCPPAMQAAGR